MKKAQGALEYLLLIGGAVLVAAIVIALIAPIAGNEEHEEWKTIEVCTEEIKTGNLYGTMTCEEVGYGWQEETPSENELYCTKCVAKQSLKCLHKDGIPLCEQGIQEN